VDGVVLCSRNRHKARELERLLPGWTIEPLDRDDYPPETGATYYENAAIKAAFGRAHAAGWVLAEDSGLEVDALNGAPGVHSARYAGDHATDAANNALLLDRLRGVENRTARFVCVIALVHDGKLVKTFRGAVEGQIIDEARGSGGFGYDPLFYCPTFRCTFGEAAIEQKMQVSHRAQALAAMFTYLRNTAST